MLKYLTIQNFKSFCKPQTFTMEADTDRVSEKRDTLITIGKNQLLRTASFYGPNGSGKSNLIKGLKFLKKAVMRDSFLLNGFSEHSIYSSCYFSDSKIISEQVIFCDEKYEYTYTFDATIEKEKQDDDFVNDLFGYRDDIIANFVGEKIEFKPLDEPDDHYETLLERTKEGKIITKYFSSLNYLKSITLGQTISAIKYIYDNNINLNSTDRPEEFNILLGLYNQISSLYSLNTQRLFADVNIIRSIWLQPDNKAYLEFLNDFDLKIKTLEFVKSNRSYKMKIIRSVQGKDVAFNLSDESDGTQRIISIATRLYLNKGHDVIFYCDDLDSQLHPKIVQALIKLFHDGRIGNKQLIFNSHDLVNMNKENFRRDEIWLTYKDENSSTVIVPLSNITNSENKQIRKDESYNKRYLEGRYGADPFVAKALHYND